MAARAQRAKWHGCSFGYPTCVGLRIETRYAVILTAVALSLRLYLSHKFYLNPDEGMNLAAGSTGAWGAFHHPPLLPWWLWFATLFSDQEWWLRLASSVAGGCTPAITGLWLRRFVSPLPAWGLATMVGVAPNLVLLSIQLRGYSLAMFGTVFALYALERAFAERSRRWMVGHFLALAIAILSEFSAAWVTLAAGLYGVARFWKEPATRTLLPVWLSGQITAAGLYAALFVLVVKPLVQQQSVIDTVQSYLAGAFPREGQSLLLFAAVGVLK